MIDAESFSKEWISHFSESDSLAKKLTVERCIHAFYLLERLAQKSKDFVFKGGTSLMLLLKEPKRFSVDIDIIMETCNFDKADKLASSLKDNYLFDCSRDQRKPSDVIKKHFKYSYHSVFLGKEEKDPYVLLDIVFEKSPYLHARPYEINMKWLKIKEPKVFVSVPSPEEMLGDKMTAFAPLSIGKLYSEGRYVEICKQLYDIAFLSRIAEDKQLIKDSYLAVSSIEIENRKGTFSQEFAQEDSLEALRLILSEGHRPTGKENFQYLQKGKKGLEDFLVEKYGGQEWLRDAADAYLVYGEIVFKKSTNKQAKNSNTFIGRRYSTLKRVLGEDKMKKLMIMVNNDPKKDN